LLKRVCAALVVVSALAGVAPAHATFPGENGQIAFTRYVGSYPQVFAVDPDGTGMHQVTSEQFGARAPQWSPDGVRIAYVAPAGGGDIFSIAPDGTGRTALTDSTVAEHDPAWSPDGTKLAFGVNLSLYVLDLRNGERTQLPHPSPDHAVGTPAWSPDGTEIAFAAAPFETWCDVEDCYVTYSPLDIWKVAAAGGDPVRLTFDQDHDRYPPGADPTEQGSPSWSPDGTRIAFDDRQDIWVMDADGGNQARLTSGAEAERQPVFSPDGTRIAFVRGSQIVTSDLTGGDVQVVTEDNLIGQPDWQPIPAVVPFTYIHPKDAAVLRVPLVPAARGCSSPNRTHGPPLAFDSCSPVEPHSPSLRVSVGNARAHSTGHVRLAVRPGSPRYPDDTDVQIRLHITNVMSAYDLSDYNGVVSLSFGVRLTDRDFGPGATLQDMTFTVYDIPCEATADPARGGICQSATSIDAVVPGAAPERQGAIWELDQVRVFDGGPYGDGADPSLFATQGVFVP
jgi:Tol biopolymer transport system component